MRVSASQFSQSYFSGFYPSPLKRKQREKESKTISPWSKKETVEISPEARELHRRATHS